MGRNGESIPQKIVCGGGTFIGGVKKGAPRGFGVLNLGGCNYIGRFKSDGSARGDVKGYSADKKLLYTGGFKRFGYHGKGTLWKHDGSKYEGEFKRGQKDGYGREWFPDGSRFKGYFKNGLRHGRGALKLPNATRTWHVWKDGQIADRETALRAKLDAAGKSISSKTKERFERYLCFYELNYWWMTALVGGLFYFILWLGYKYGTKPDVPQDFTNELRKEPEIRKCFWRGAAFGWHKRRLGMRNWVFYPTLLFSAAIFASQELLLFVPFPRIWICFPTFPMASIVCIVVFVGMCIYDLGFGIGYDVYRFNWRWFWNPEYDERLRQRDDDIFNVADTVREHVENIRDEVENALKEAKSIYAELHKKHLKDDRNIFTRGMAKVSEAFFHKEEEMTHELSAIERRVKKNAKIINKDGKTVCDALNTFHEVFRRARTVSFEVLDEAMARPVQRSEYERKLDKITPVTVQMHQARAENRLQVRSVAYDITDSRCFASVIKGLYDLGSLISDVFSPLGGRKPQLAKLREDQAAFTAGICNAIPKLGDAYAAIQEGADRLEALAKATTLFYIHYDIVRKKMLGTPSFADYWRRHHGYKGRDAIMSDEAVKAEFEKELLPYLVELTRRFKELDGLPELGQSTHSLKHT